MKNKNLWAPWRIGYIQSLGKKEAGGEAESNRCFFCEYQEQPEKDDEHLVLWRTAGAIAVMNRFPYTGGHLLVAPKAHVESLDMLDDHVLHELILLTRDAETVLKEVVQPHGFNVGMNISRCAGAGLPGHIHMHIVPRWQGDTNFMDVVGDIRVISVELAKIYETMKQVSQRLGLPRSKQ